MSGLPPPNNDRRENDQPSNQGRSNLPKPPMDVALARIKLSFEELAHSKRWNILSDEDSQQWSVSWQNRLSDYVLRDLADTDQHKRSALLPRIIGVAHDDKTFFALVCITDITERRCAYIGPSGKLLQLEQRAAIGTFVEIPLEQSSEATAISEWDGSDPNALADMPYIDRESLSIEARRFASTDQSGIIGDIFKASLLTEGFSDRHRWSFCYGSPTTSEPQLHSFHCHSAKFGSLLLEVGIEPESLALSTRLIGLSNYMHALEPADEQFSASLQGLRRLPSDKLARLGFDRIATVEARPFKIGNPEVTELVKEKWRSFGAEFPWQINCQDWFQQTTDNGSKIFVKTEIKDRSGNYIIPSIGGLTPFRSHTPAALYFEIYKRALSENNTSLALTPRMIELPKDIPLSVFLTHELEDPRSSLLKIYTLNKIRDERDRKNVDWLRDTPKATLVPDHPSAFFSAHDEKGNVFNETAKIIWFHNLGAHLLTVRAGEAGLIDLYSDLILDCFFRELPPFE